MNSKNRHIKKHDLGNPRAWQFPIGKCSPRTKQIGCFQQKQDEIKLNLLIFGDKYKVYLL